MTKRTIKDVKIVDVQKRKIPSKHYVYVISVTWSDGSVNVVYRRYSKFFDLQTKLLEEFPDEGGVKDPSARVLPFLPGKILFGRSHVRDVAVKRKEPIQEYCSKLVELPPKISQSGLVLKFFEPKPEDIELPLEKKKKKKETADVISDPVSLEQYVAIADYQKQNRNEITMVAGDIVEVIDKNENGWWFVNLDEEQGWVPAAYLESVDGHSDDAAPIEGPTVEVGQYITTTSHKAELDDEITFETGVIVSVIQKNFDGWWLIRYQDKEGWAPAMYLRKPDPSQLHAAQAVGGLPSKDRVGAVTAPAAVRPGVNPVTGNKGKRVPPRQASVRRSVKKPLSITNFSYGKGIEAMPALKSPDAEYFTVGEFRALGIQSGLDFSKGASVEVLDKNPNGWWYGKIDGNEGWIPSSYLGKREKSVKKKATTSPKPARFQVIDPPKNAKPVFGELHSKPKPERPKIPDHNRNTEQKESPKPLRFQIIDPPKDTKPSSGISTSKRIPERPKPPDLSARMKASPPKAQELRTKPKPVMPDIPDTGSKPKPARPPVSKKITIIPNNELSNSFQNDLKSALRSAGPSAHGVEEVYVAKSDYEDKSDGVLSFREGDNLVLMEKRDDGWWFVRMGSKEGWVLGSYLEAKTPKVNQPHGKPGSPKVQPRDLKPAPPPRPSQPYYRNQTPKPKRDKPVPIPRSAPKPAKPVGRLDVTLFESKIPVAPPRAESKGYVPKDTGSGKTGNTKDVISGVKSLCVAKMDYVHEGEDAMSFSEGEEFEFLEDSHSGWWLVRTLSGQENWAPANFLEMKSPEYAKQDKPAKHVYVALASYHDEDDDAISFDEGDEMEVVQQDDSGWWLVKIADKSGWAPSNFLKQL
ncbi:SH3 and PX domain-containing protein 2B [Nematostella vectensis]|uniref:SH3 and PX domain-containing protein 2B n=1 Tax=Nematostella vectensis TaxID=45351 RepID=UPI0020772F9A|nr:SH3 and PX domain-containing protein 2B [Nematostella vectensis]